MIFCSVIAALSAALAVSVCGGRTQQAQSSHADAWEYKVVTDFKPGKDEQKINELGAQGWEVVQVLPDLDGGTYVSKADLIFKRGK